MSALKKIPIIVLMSLFLINALLSCSTRPKTPTQAVEGFLNSVKAGQYQRAFYLFVADGKNVFAKLKKGGDFDEWDKKIRDVTFRVIKEEIDGDQARVKYEIYDKRQDDTDTEWFELNKIDDTWKIDPEFL